MSKLTISNLLLTIRRFYTKDIIEKARNVSRLDDYLRQREKGLEYDYESAPKKWPNLTRQAFWALHEQNNNNIDASVCWPTVDEIKVLKEDEKNYDLSFEQRKEIVENRRNALLKEHNERQNKLKAAVTELPKHMAKFIEDSQRISQTTTIEEKEKKNLRQIARMEYGFDVDERDQRMRYILDDIEEKQKLEVKKERKAEKARLAAEKLQKILSDLNDT